MINLYDAIVFGFILGMVCAVPIAILLHFVRAFTRIESPDDEYYDDFP